MDGIGAEVGGDGVAQHIQFHRALEKNAAEPIVVVVQRTLNGGEDGLGEVGGVDWFTSKMRQAPFLR